MALGPVIFKLHLFESPTDRQRSETCILWLCEALAAIDKTWIEAYPQTPPLYQAPVKYHFDPARPDAWKDIPTIIKDGHGDCEDLACWRVAELRASGIPARPYIKWRRGSKGMIYHVVAWHPDGRIEDPSLALGMRGPSPRHALFIGEDLEYVRGLGAAALMALPFIPP